MHCGKRWNSIAKKPFKPLLQTIAKSNSRYERTELLKHLREQKCVFIREGRRHSWWLNPAQNRRLPSPDTRKFETKLARKICKDLGVPFP